MSDSDEDKKQPIFVNQCMEKDSNCTIANIFLTRYFEKDDNHALTQTEMDALMCFIVSVWSDHLVKFLNTFLPTCHVDSKRVIQEFCKGGNSKILPYIILYLVAIPEKIPRECQEKDMVLFLLKSYIATNLKEQENEPNFEHLKQVFKSAHVVYPYCIKILYKILTMYMYQNDIPFSVTNFISKPEKMIYVNEFGLNAEVSKTIHYVEEIYYSILVFINTYKNRFGCLSKYFYDKFTTVFISVQKHVG
jgi:hypothetical protein